MGCSASTVAGDPHPFDIELDDNAHTLWVPSRLDSLEAPRSLSSRSARSSTKSTKSSRSRSDEKQNAGTRLRRCYQWYDALCQDGSDVVDIAAFSDPRTATEAYKSGLRVIKLLGQELETELGDGTDSGHGSSNGSLRGNVVEFPDFFSKIKWWSDAPIEDKLERAFSLFFGNGLASTKEDVVILLDSIFPCLSRPTLVDIAKSVLLSAQIESMLLQGKHKFVEGISKKEFVDWMWRCQFAPKHGCDKDMLSVDFKGKHRASWELRTPLQRGTTRAVQTVHIKVSQASVNAVAAGATAVGRKKKTKKGNSNSNSNRSNRSTSTNGNSNSNSNIGDDPDNDEVGNANANANAKTGWDEREMNELVPVDPDGADLVLPDSKRASQGSKKTRRSSGTHVSNVRNVSLTRRNSRKSVTSQHAHRGSIAEADSVIKEENAAPT